MRKTVLWQSLHVRVSLSALLTFVAVLALAGCGGGGGGTTTNGGTTTAGTTAGTTTGGTTTPPPGQNATLAFITGRVTDTSGTTGVVGATVTVTGTSISAVTGTGGAFTLANVPLTARQFTVTSPDVNKYYNFAIYNSKQYDTINCPLPLPSLSAGANSLSVNIELFNSGNNPPPPPPVNGCPQ